MAGKTPREAVGNFLHPLQQALSCVTKAVLKVSGGYRPQQAPHILLLGSGNPAPRQGAPRLSLTVMMHYRILQAPGDRGPWKVNITAYYYAMDDRDGHEILAYHWHPEGSSPVRVPHLHLGAAARVGYQQLSEAHLPTGRVALEEVLRLAIAELGVKALRTDWAEVLAKTQHAFEQYRTWPAPTP